MAITVEKNRKLNYSKDVNNIMQTLKELILVILSYVNIAGVKFVQNKPKM